MSLELFLGWICPPPLLVYVKRPLVTTPPKFAQEKLGRFLGTSLPRGGNLGLVVVVAVVVLGWNCIRFISFRIRVIWNNHRVRAFLEPLACRAPLEIIRLYISTYYELLSVNMCRSSHLHMLNPFT